MNNNPEITYRGGQTPIVHLLADLYHTVSWADKNNKKWVFTNSNAGSNYFEDFNDLSQLNQLNWNAVNANYWEDCREQKQAEFLLEERFPWFLVDEIGVYSKVQKKEISAILHTVTHQPPISIKKRVVLLKENLNMITYKAGDIFKEKEDAIVNTVNCVGVMGRGIALQFKRQFPSNFKVYAAACKQKKVMPGKMLIYEICSQIGPKYIINFPTKRHWRSTSRMKDIESGLQDLAKVITNLDIKSIALPSLGCGLGGLDWNDVRVRIESTLSHLPEVKIIIFEPKGAPQADKMVKNRKIPNMTPGRATMVMLMHRYLTGLLDPIVSLLVVHKLMYFLQESGEPLRLNYVKNIYGPYAVNLSHVLNAVEGHLFLGYADGGDRPDKELKLLPGAYEYASKFLQKHPQTKQHLHKVSNLVEGFESPFGMELLATVHWVTTKENATSKEQVVAKVHQWNKPKSQFTPRQIELAYNILKKEGWIDKAQS